MALTASAVLPVLDPKNLSDMIFTRHATPVTPIPLLPDAPMAPDTCVPCQSVSGFSKVFARLCRKSQPFLSSTYPLPSSSAPLPMISREFTQAFGARSGCDKSMPVSMTATTKLLLPVVKSHARVALMSAPGLPVPKTPVFIKDHCCEKSESLGIRDGNRR